MKICMITSSLGLDQDSAAVVRLTRALARRGHAVHIVFSGDANEQRGIEALPTFAGRVALHALRSHFGRMATLYTQQTSRIGSYRSAIFSLLQQEQFDVIHLHDCSRLGGLELVAQIGRKMPNAVKLMSVHDHWLICPLAKLWQFGSQSCEKPECTRCTLAAGALPQLWRSLDGVRQALNHLDALLFPSLHAHDLHTARGVNLAQAVTLPPFLEAEWAEGALELDAPMVETPYFVLCGDLLRENGFQTVIPLMKQTLHANLVVIGEGDDASELFHLAHDMPNVSFVGRLAAAQRAALIANATALIVPSLLQEAVGDQVLEAYSLATPAIVRNRGALPEFVARSGGGMLFENSAELLDKMHLLLQKPRIGKRMGSRALQEWCSYWSESNHVALYFDLIRTIQLRRDLQLTSV